MFCFAEDNTIIAGRENTITEAPEQIPHFQTLSLPAVRGCRPGDNPLFPSTVLCIFGLFTRLSSSSKTSKLSDYFYINIM